MDLLLKSVGKIEINDVVTWPYILPLDFVDAMCHYPFKNRRKHETLKRERSRSLYIHTLKKKKKTLAPLIQILSE